MSGGLGWQLLTLMGGLYLLVRGAEHLVEGAAAVAVRLGVKPLMVGLTIVAFGTSAPELATSVSAAFRAAAGEEGAADVAVGNVVGSNICNIALILGLAAMFMPIRVRSSLIRREIPYLIGMTLLLTILAWRGSLDRFAGIVLLTVFAAFIIMVAIISIRERQPPAHLVGEDLKPERLGRIGPVLATIHVVLGIGLLALGADLLVTSALDVAEALGVQDAIIGLTIVAFGTSLPELAATVVAARAGEQDIALGNVVGSNIFNIGLVLGVPAVAVGVPFTPGLVTLDMAIMVAFTVALVPVCLTRGLVSRREGAILLGGYALYMLFLAHEAFVA